MTTPQQIQIEMRMVQTSMAIRFMEARLAEAQKLQELLRFSTPGMAADNLVIDLEHELKQLQWKLDVDGRILTK